MATMKFETEKHFKSWWIVIQKKSHVSRQISGIQIYLWMLT